MDNQNKQPSPATSPQSPLGERDFDKSDAAREDHSNHSQLDSLETINDRDTLTGLHSENYLYQAIDRCLQQVQTQKLAATLALLQLENFYEIRSWVGKSEANLLLSDIAQVLKNALPENVLLCRCNNYEFAALLVADCSVNARLITDKVKQAMLCAVSPLIPPQLELKCGVGLAALESNIPSWAVVFARARHNLSLAHYHKELPAHLLSISPESALKQLQLALKKTPLALSFQATVNLQDDALQHYEVRCLLSRNEDTLPTALLFETAARNALGEQLDQRIINQVLQLLSEVNQSGLRLSINLSHNSLVSKKFLHWLTDRLTKNSAWAAQLVFQISETDALVAQHHLAYFCESIGRLGSKIALSKFGCTPDPLRYLSLVPASYIKLDAEMLAKIHVNQEKYENLHDMVGKLHDTGLRVIAPMLEELSILLLLWQMKIDFVQGNCLHAPADSMDFEFPGSQTLKLSQA